jgi:hypothetical protein
MKPHTFTQELYLHDEDETPVMVEYSYLPGAPEQGPSYASGGQPADPPEIDIVNIFIKATGDKIGVTEAEFEKFHELLLENHVDDGPDPDDARDARMERAELDREHDLAEDMGEDF